MPRNLTKALLVACILTGAVCAQPRLVKTQIRDTQRIRMNGHLHPLAKAENDLGSLDSGVTLPAVTLVLGQTQEQETALTAFLSRTAGPRVARLPSLAHTRAVRRPLRCIVR